MFSSLFRRRNAEYANPATRRGSPKWRRHLTERAARSKAQLRWVSLGNTSSARSVMD